MKFNKQALLDIFLIFIGTSIYSFGLVVFNIPNNLAEGGVTGITLIIYNMIGFNPAYSTLLLNIPLILIGLKIFGFRSLIYTLVGTFSLSLNILLWQKANIAISVDNDLLIAALLAGLFGGVGSGIVYKVGGTTGGTDIVARIIEKNIGLTMGRSMLILDVIVLILSLSYLSLKEMMYTLIAVFVFSIVVDFVQEGSYSARGILIISDKNDLISSQILEELERGSTFLKSEGAYSNVERDIIYCVASPPEINTIKDICHEIDPKAFISVLTINEVIGEGFSYEKMKAIKRKR
ncbi:YitT family protein [Vagococcus carniphilus]|uniref:YitT family protein n=1 Tax=Vagococcus carniphilus TaxID=218144 RepID=A0A430B583_9ENTE|nr:YitT family protein [Vagococcus carniphilus]MDT2815831.1 YitT family protein [Vagococcus carniphilus]MDT2829658.1 YitT family protein [Vagococcus carniphilus]MDT2833640.1 YitT family protein [Vagococcus carniphilus]MDT2839117.1 YitT family protein [Vagococcus carniphilus]MDT2847593.1 YitT family protein [Vagococcus carniphilus]